MKRVEVIEQAGVLAWERGGSPSRAMIRAIAAMLDVAVGSTRQKRHVLKMDVDKLPFGPKAVFEALDERCADVIQMRPYETSSFGRLGRVLFRVQGLEEADLERLVGWIQSGGLATWPTTVTWAHVVKHIANWISYARAWDDQRKANPGASGASAWR